MFADGKHGNSLVSCDEQQFTQQRIFIFPANAKVHWHNWPKKAVLKGCAEQLKPAQNRPANCQCKRTLLNVKWKACVDAVMCSVLGASSVSPLSSSDCPKSTATLELRTSFNALRNVCWARIYIITINLPLSFKVTEKTSRICAPLKTLQLKTVKFKQASGIVSPLLKIHPMARSLNCIMDMRENH